MNRDEANSYSSEAHEAYWSMSERHDALHRLLRENDELPNSIMAEYELVSIDLRLLRERKMVIDKIRNVLSLLEDPANNGEHGMNLCFTGLRWNEGLYKQHEGVPTYPALGRPAKFEEIWRRYPPAIEKLSSAKAL